MPEGVGYKDEDEKKKRKKSVLDFVNSLTPQGRFMDKASQDMQTATEQVKKRKKEQGK